MEGRASMTKWRKGDWERTKEVIAGKRPAIENGETWLRHSEGSSCFKIDLEILKGTSSVEEIAKASGCPINRVTNHLYHLQEKKDRTMEPHHLRVHEINGKVMFNRDLDPTDTSAASDKTDIDGSETVSLSSHSWTIEHKDSACKILDKSAFLHRGTGVPVEIRSFFLSQDIKAGERRNISLVHDGNAYSAHIDFESTDTARTRLFWNTDFSALMKSTFPYHYQQYSNNQKPDSKIIVRFKRLSGYEQYQVSFAGEVSVDSTADDIEADELEDKGPQKEGAIKEYYGKRYERSPINRKKAIQIHGIACNVCGFNFEAVYGARGADYIDVHHVKQISTFTEEQYVDPQIDLITICSNCHRMIHRKPNDILTVEQLRNIIQEMEQNVCGA